MEVQAREDVDKLLFQFHMWYDVFKKNTIKSKIIPLSAEFISYLDEDGVILPQEANHVRPRQANEYDDVAADEEDRQSASSGEEAVAPSFPELSSQIQEALNALGGQVFIKLNWSCPSDAAWVLGSMDGSLKCINLSDIYLLLKSSDRIQYDISHMISVHSTASSGGTNSCSTATPSLESAAISTALNVTDGATERSRHPSQPTNLQYSLVVKQWRTINPAMEFRLFVRDNYLLGISQRDCFTFYPFLLAEFVSLAYVMKQFFQSVIQGKFLCSSYAVDVYVTTNHSVKIIDFNYFGPPTDPLMFEWDYLRTLPMNEEWDPETRCVRSEGEVMIDTRGTSRGPIDVALAPDFQRFMQICQEQAREDD